MLTTQLSTKPVCSSACIRSCCSNSLQDGILKSSGSIVAAKFRMALQQLLLYYKTDISWHMWSTCRCTDAGVTANRPMRGNVEYAEKVNISAVVDPDTSKESLQDCLYHLHKTAQCRKVCLRHLTCRVAGARPIANMTRHHAIWC
jgi:hypothetical protein